MSDRVERAVEAVNSGQNLTRVVNNEMTREEQLQFARQLWENGTNRTPQAPGVWTGTVGGAEVTFRTVNGERQVSDIVLNGRDIYDTPEDVARRQGREQAARQRRDNPPTTGIGTDGRYSGNNGTGGSNDGTGSGSGTGSNESRRADYLRCMDGSSRRRVDEAECAAVHAYDAPGIRRTQITERPGPGASAAKSLGLPSLELVESK